MNSPRRWGRFPKDVAHELGVSERTARNYAGKPHQYFKLYRLRGRTGVQLVADLDEVNAAMRSVRGRTAKAGYGSYGGALIVDLVEVEQVDQ